MNLNLSIETQNKLHSNFDQFDKDKDGFIYYQELKELMKETTSNLTEADLQDLLNDTDMNEKGQIKFQTYVEIVNKINKKNDSEDELIQAFKIFDKDDSGLISAKKIMDVFIKIDDKLKEEEVLQMIKEFDMDQDGYLNYEEFCAMVKNK
jgi:calmodulin